MKFGLLAQYDSTLKVKLKEKSEEKAELDNRDVLHVVKWSLLTLLF